MNAKLQLVHCVDDLKMGGVNVALTHLCQSALADEVDMQIVAFPLKTALPTLLNADIICLHNASNWQGIKAVLWCRLQLFMRRSKAKIILQEHHYSAGFMRHEVQQPQRFVWMLRLHYALMDAVIAISPSQQQWMGDYRLAPASKIHLLGQGRDLTARFFSSLSSTGHASQLGQSQFGLSEYLPQPTMPIECSDSSDSSDSMAASDVTETIHLLAYGRFHRQKGFDLLIKAMPRVSHLPVSLTLMGQGEEREHYLQLSADNPRIHIIDAVDNVANVIAQFDAVVIPSRWEPFGLTMLESMAMGKSVIASEVDGLSDQAMLAPVEVYIIETLSVENIATAIEQFCSNYTASPVKLQSQWAEVQWQNVVTHWRELLRSL